MTKTCSKCNQEKPLSEFRTDSRYTGGVRCWCKKCEHEYQCNVHANLTEDEREQKRTYNRKNYSKFQSKYTADTRRRREKLKCEVMSHYSNGEPKCNYCGFSDIRALAIDHINNDGAEHLKKLSGSARTGGGASRLYFWLKNNNYPDGFQVLCFNCNTIKAMEDRRKKAEDGAYLKNLTSI